MAATSTKFDWAGNRKTKPLPPPMKWAGKRQQSSGINLRCVYHTRVVVPSDKTTTGLRYDFEPDEIQEVDSQDVPLLLSLLNIQTSCCGGTSPQNLPYFIQEV